MSALQYYPIRSFVGLSASDGNAIRGDEHLRASIRDILTTPIGTRVMRRDYGSRLFELMDRPFGPGLAAEIISATAEALEIWEPRLELKQVLLNTNSVGKVQIDIIYDLAGREQFLENVA